MNEFQQTQKPAIILSDEIVEENAQIADGQADSTHDGGHRPPEWKPVIVTKLEYESEFPYKK